MIYYFPTNTAELSSRIYSNRQPHEFLNTKFPEHYYLLTKENALRNWKNESNILLNCQKLFNLIFGTKFYSSFPFLLLLWFFERCLIKCLLENIVIKILLHIPYTNLRAKLCCKITKNPLQNLEISCLEN